MKKMFFAVAIAAMALVSCNKENQSQNAPTSDGQNPVTVSFGTENPKTRAFFDNVATAEVWEKDITTLSVYVFDQSGNILLKRFMTSAEVAAKSATFSIPTSAAGTTCAFYVVANEDYGTVNSVSAMESKIEMAGLNDYNGTAAEVLSGSKRSSGFVMNGSANTAISAVGTSTNVSVVLKRVVAKVAVQATMSADFSANYNGGTVTITSATISKVNVGSNSFYKSGSTYPGPMSFTHTQTSNLSLGNSQNLFYIYETDASANVDNRCYLILDGYFDADGSSATTYDRSDVQYKVILDGHSNGEIIRNGYYRVNATIKGLSGDGLILQFTVSDWETPKTQDSDLGI